jgi:hypothetical protein
VMTHIAVNIIHRKKKLGRERALALGYVTSTVRGSGSPALLAHAIVLVPLLFTESAATSRSPRPACVSSGRMSSRSCGVSPFRRKGPI